MSERLFDTWPILVYPCRIYDGARGQLRSPKPDQMVPGADYAMFNDLGVYGVPKPVKEKQRYVPKNTYIRFYKPLCGRKRVNL